MLEQIVRCVGLLLVMFGASLAIVARLTLGDSWSATPKAPRQLVAVGLYSRIRNPMYVFNWIMVLGVVMALQWKHLWWVLIVLAVIQYWRANAEAKVLLDKFGFDYMRYRKQTWF